MRNEATRRWQPWRAMRYVVFLLAIPALVLLAGAVALEGTGGATAVASTLVHVLDGATEFFVDEVGTWLEEDGQE